MGRRKRGKVTAKDWETFPDYVWREEDGNLVPQPFFLRWWQDVAEKRFNNKERWLEIAMEFGYVNRDMEPIGFDYDPTLYRISLDIPVGMPLLSQNGVMSRGLNEAMWDWLLGNRGENDE